MCSKKLNAGPWKLHAETQVVWEVWAGDGKCVMFSSRLHSQGRVRGVGDMGGMNRDVCRRENVGGVKWGSCA